MLRPWVSWAEPKKPKYILICHVISKMPQSQNCHQYFSWPGPAATFAFLCLFSPVTVILLICLSTMRCCVELLCKILTLFMEVCNMLSIPRYCFKSTRMLYSSITSYHFQQILVSQSAIICHEILSTAFFSTSQTSKMHCSTTADRRIILQPRYVVVGRYQKQNTFVKSPKQNWNSSFYTYS